jgi:hypothetical protein
MNKFILIVSFIVGVMASVGSIFFWGNNFLSGGYNAFTAFIGWAFPLIASVILLTILAAFLVIKYNVGFKYIASYVLAPYAIGLVLTLLVVVLIIKFQ